jgi:hypothetical protein
MFSGPVQIGVFSPSTHAQKHFALACKDANKKTRNTKVDATFIFLI